MTKAIGVTGASGFIGKAVVRAIIDQGGRAVAIDRKALALTAPSDVAAFYEAHNITSVIALGAPNPKEVDLTLQGIENYLTSLESLIVALPKGGCFLYTGSMAEFGTAGHHHDDTLRRPNTEYGLLKSIAADRVTSALLTHGVRGGIARLFGVYGPGEAASRLIPSLIARLRQSESVDLSDGLQIRDFVYVEDVAQVLVALLEKDIAGRCLNIGTGVGHSVRSVCMKVSQTLGQPPELLNFGSKPRLPHDEAVVTAQVTRLQSILGYAPPDRISDPKFWTDMIAAYQETASP